MQNLQDVHVALTDYGFMEYTPWKRGVYKYTGQLHTKMGSFDVELTLKDLDRPPAIRLVQVPDQLKPRAPHIGASGTICYTASGAIAWDIFNPASQIIACVDRATEVLSQILGGERVADLAEEFFVYWSSNKDLVLLDVNNVTSGYVSFMGLTNAEGDVVSVVLSDDRSRTLKKIAYLKAGLTEFEVPACIVESSVNPMPLTDGQPWPPKNLDEFINWQYSLDPKSARSIIRRLKKLFEEGHSFLVILISSPTAKYSAAISLPEKHIPLKSIPHARRILGGSKLTVMETVRIDDMYMVERNQPNRASLVGKNILLIGAGAIGGNLADLLVRGGAGFKEGKLTIIDKDYLGAGNIGRHKLGFESLFASKSEALAQQIRNSFPTVNIDASGIDVKTFEFSDDYDLVINATGEQSLSDWLSMTLNQIQFFPVLTIWIEGPGAVVRSILQPTKEAACYRCLSDIDRIPLYPSVNEEYEIRLGGHGCESLFVQYPATASVFAAALASSQIMDWVNGEGAPLLRTMVIDKNYTPKTLDQNPTKNIDCPACHTTQNG